MVDGSDVCRSCGKYAAREGRDQSRPCEHQGRGNPGGTVSKHGALGRKVDIRRDLLPLEGPILRVQGIIGAIKFDDILLLLRQRRRIGLARTEGGQGFLGDAGLEAGTDCRTVLASLGCDATECGRMPLQREVIFGLDPRYGAITRFD